jgi:hypothetical protein
MAPRRNPDIASRPIGDEQANTLQPTDSGRHTTTANAKVRATIAASPLVRERPCLFHTAEIAILAGEVLEAGGH